MCEFSRKPKLHTVQHRKGEGGGLWQRKFKAFLENKKSSLTNQVIATQVRIFLKNIKAVIFQICTLHLNYHCTPLTWCKGSSFGTKLICSAAHGKVLQYTCFSTRISSRVCYSVYLFFLCCPILISLFAKPNENCRWSCLSGESGALRVISISCSHLTFSYVNAYR